VADGPTDHPQGGDQDDQEPQNDADNQDITEYAPVHEAVGPEGDTGSQQAAESDNPLADAQEAKEVRKTYRGGPKARTNWALLQTEFIEGIVTDAKKPEDRWFPTQKELAERHGVSYQTVRARAGKERWTDRKEAHAIQTIKERQRKRTKKLAEQALTWDEKTFDTAQLGMNLVTQRLAEIAKDFATKTKLRQEALARKAAGQPVEKEDLYSAVNYREMEGLANAARTFQDIGMKALGTDVQKHEISGPDGGALEVAATLNVTQEITRDDPERVAAILASIKDAGLLQLLGPGMDEDIVDADIED
jgi:hypothetical protein